MPEKVTTTNNNKDDNVTRIAEALNESETLKTARATPSHVLVKTVIASDGTASEGDKNKSVIAAAVISERVSPPPKKG